MKVSHERDRGTRDAGSNFDGHVWRTDFLEAEPGFELTGQRFSYEPGARSHWHIHTDEQALIVLAGRGLIGWEGLTEPEVVESGDWVYVKPGVPHWHGAHPSDIFIHAAVTAGGETHWLGPVDALDSSPPSS